MRQLAVGAAGLHVSAVLPSYMMAAACTVVLQFAGAGLVHGHLPLPVATPEPHKRLIGLAMLQVEASSKA